MKCTGSVIVSVLFLLLLPPVVAEEHAGWWSGVERNLAASEYEIAFQGEWQAPNRAHDLRTFFNAEGIRVVRRTEVEPTWEWRLSWVGYGRGGSSWPVAAPSLDARGPRIDYRRGPLLEWYENSPRGLEQGFVLPAPPEEIGGAPRDASGVPVFVELALAGSLRPALSADRLSVDFEMPGGGPVIHYADLRVTDARGETLPAWIEGYAGTASRGIRIVIDDRDAVYPIGIDPLATSPAWTVHGGQTGASLGISVATAGDVNGDGYSDAIVGAYGYDNGETDEGRAFVYLGSPSGLATSPSWSAEGNQASAYFGVSVATAGDVNGDGYSDVVIGAYQYDNGQTNEGRAFVYLGSVSGLAAAPVWTAEADQASAYFGYSVATAGDVDGDGYSDIVIGAYLYDNGQTDEGRAFLFRGSPSGPGAAPAWTAEPNQATAYFGESVATAGDVNGDGYSDVIVGSRLFGSGGRAFVYLGGPGGLATSASWTADGAQGGAHFGRSVATAGDVNGDGYADIVVGAPMYDNGQTDEGKVFVYHGSPSGPSVAANWTAESDQAAGAMGRSVATAGDVNGDGYADVVLGAPSFDDGQTDEGRVFVHLGSASGLSPAPAWTADSDQANAQFGYSVSTVGDANGDGYSDVIVGAFQFDQAFSNEGQSRVYLGSASGPSTSIGWQSPLSVLDSAPAGDVNGDGFADVLACDGAEVQLHYGSATGPSVTADWTSSILADGGPGTCSVGAAGDVNNDGYDDFLVGDEFALLGGLNHGAVHLFLGSGGSSSPTLVSTRFGETAGSRFGSNVASAGDVDGDGFADLLVGAPDYDGAGTDCGKVYLYRGFASPTMALPWWTFEGPSWSQVGPVASAGDVNGDGFDDVIVGAPGWPWGGRAFVFHGSPTGLSTEAAWGREGEDDGANYGWSVGTAGDVNGDGFADVLVGANRGESSNPENDEGLVRVYHGSPLGVQWDPAWTGEGNQPGANFGSAAACAGDVNGDGHADVIVGAPRWDGIDLDTGRAQVFLGSVSGLSAGADWTTDGQAYLLQLGSTVAGAGDVNGDGYADVLVDDRLYYGNGGRGVALRPRQLRQDGAPLAHLGESDQVDEFTLGLDARTPFGRGNTRLQWEAKGLGELFDGLGLRDNGAWIDTGVGGAPIEYNQTDLSGGSVVHWRARLRYAPATTPFQSHGRWVTVPWNGWQEADLRMDWKADLSVTMTDSPDPQFEGQQIDYRLVVSNAGPSATGATLRDVLPSGSTYLGYASSQGSCAPTGGAVDCELGEIAAGDSVQVMIFASAPMGWGTAWNSASVETVRPAEDPDLSNGNASESTQIRALNVGDHVWRDLDRDGIQDEGEPGLPGVVVLLYNGAGQLLDAAATNHNGYYVFFEGLQYGTLYHLRFVPPVGFQISPQDQGADDAADSDADPLTGDTPVFSLTEFSDATGWDAGMHDCWAPDEPVWLYEVGVTNDGNDYPVLNFQDPNQPGQITGYSVYRSDTPGAIWPWPLVASDVVDMDEATPNKQWVDTSGDVPPSGIWYYQITAYNHRCPAEGPR